MMFGDLGHGSIIFMFASFMTLFNSWLKGGILDILLPYRYLFLLLGFMSAYAGLLYNEFFALPMDLFGSCYNVNHKEIWVPTQDEDGNIEGDYTYLRNSHQCNYAVGFDPVWALTKTRLTFSNNVKMKLAVIMGVIHMSIGIVIKGSNALYFRRWADLWTEVCTGLVILLGLFGWMDVLIYAKWFHYLDIEDKTILNEEELLDSLNQDLDATPKYKGDYDNEHMPSVINIMITTVFGFGKVPDSEKDYATLIGTDQEMQYSISTSLLLIAISLIPIMLLVKPCFFRPPEPEADENANQEIEMSENNNNQPRSSEESNSADVVKAGKNNIKTID